MQKNGKVALIGAVVLVILIAITISINAQSPSNEQVIHASAESFEESTTELPSEETVSPTSDESIEMEASIPPTSLPETSETVEDTSEVVPEESVPPVTELPAEPDIITTVQVRLYNDHANGFNPTDGAAYCKDIAALLTQHAPKGLRIGAGCAMAYTEGGAGKKGVYASTNNCFGIRATSGWKGWVFSRTTQTVYKDYQTALRYGADDLFRAYPTMEDSVKDYIAHMKNDRYGKVLTMDNDSDYLHHIVNQGYGEKHLAEDWLYLIRYYNLTQYDIDWSADELA